MSTTTKKAPVKTATKAASVTSNQSMTFEQRLRQSPQAKEEQQLLWNVKDNLNTLSDTIEATKRKLTEEIRSRENILDQTNVDWNALAAKDVKIEGYQAGLERLKQFRQTEFPNWQAIAIED